MGRHFVNTAWTDYYAGRYDSITWVDCSSVDDSFDLDARDVLSDPNVEDLLPLGLSLWPQGAAWGTPDGEVMPATTTLANLTRALLAPFADLYRRAWRVLEESRVGSIVDSLDDWEIEYGLPDPCVTVPQSDGLRRKVLKQRVQSMATITPADVVRLAASFGYVVALEEPEAFEAGVSTCGGGDEVSGTALEQQFLIRIHDVPVVQFEVGVSEAGVDRLLDFDIGTLQCAIKRIAPAWTYPVFSIEPVPVAFLLSTQDGRVFATQRGEVLIAPLLPNS